MRSSRTRWSIALLVTFLNMVGSPMAWAQWLGGHADTHVPSMAGDSGVAKCHGQASASPDQSPAPDLPPCCDGGGCTCAAPALSIYFPAQPVRTPHPAFSAPYEPTALPAHPLDDSLRPPIR